MLKPALISMLMLTALVVLVVGLKGQGGLVHSETLTVHCAAGLQPAIQEIVRRYEDEYGVKVVLNLGGSGVLESQLKIAGGDLFIPADDSYLLRAKEDGFIESVMPIVTLRAVIVVQKGNPQEIESISDLKREGIRLSMADATAAIGNYVQDALINSGDWSGVTPQVIVTKPTVNHVVEDVANATVDATLAWDTIAASYENVDIIRVPLFEQQPCVVSVGMIRDGNTEEAKRFMDYLVNDSFSEEIFDRLGYERVSKHTNRHE